MAINLYYRISSTPDVPTQTAVIAAPLTMEQIDGNFKSISDYFGSHDDDITDIRNILTTKVDKGDAEFNKSLTLNPVDRKPSHPKNGQIIFFEDRLWMYRVSEDGTGDWYPIYDGASGAFVNKAGDTMTGPLNGTTAKFTGATIQSTPPGTKEGSTASPEDVATANWTKDQLNNVVKKLFDVDNVDNINNADTTLKGNVNITYIDGDGNQIMETFYNKATNTFMGNFDMGTF